MSRYNCSLDDILHGGAAWSVFRHYYSRVDDVQKHESAFLYELLMIRNSVFSLPDDDSILTSEEINHIIDFICTG